MTSTSRFALPLNQFAVAHALSCRTKNYNNIRDVFERRAKFCNEVVREKKNKTFSQIVAMEMSLRNLWKNVAVLLRQSVNADCASLGFVKSEEGKERKKKPSCASANRGLSGSRGSIPMLYSQSTWKVESGTNSIATVGSTGCGLWAPPLEQAPPLVFSKLSIFSLALLPGHPSLSFSLCPSVLADVVTFRPRTRVRVAPQRAKRVGIEKAESS